MSKTWHPEGLDTRQKIVDRSLVPPGDYLYVSGWFDPLIAAHAARLAELRLRHTGLVVVITDPPHPILPARARAELVAALAAVDFVVLSGEASLHLESEQAVLRDQLIAHTARRNQQ